jgi:hypothetical protein
MSMPDTVPDCLTRIHPRISRFPESCFAPERLEIRFATRNETLECGDASPLWILPSLRARNCKE